MGIFHLSGKLASAVVYMVPVHREHGSKLLQLCHWLQAGCFQVN